MAENTCFLSLLMGLRLHNTCCQGKKIVKYAEQYCALMYAIYSINVKVRSYINFNLKFHDYSMFFTTFHVANKLYHTWFEVIYIN